MSALKRAAVVGLGDQSQAEHLPALAECRLAELAAVCDIDPQRAAVQSGKWQVPGFTDLGRLLGEVRPDFVVAAVPHHAGGTSSRHVPGRGARDEGKAVRHQPARGRRTGRPV
ncbi:Gfo/Idh/MocA family oxidoreductase [Streptomyces stramineus]